MTVDNNKGKGQEEESGTKEQLHKMNFGLLWLTMTIHGLSNSWSTSIHKPEQLHSCFCSPHFQTGEQVIYCNLLFIGTVNYCTTCCCTQQKHSSFHLCTQFSSMHYTVPVTVYTVYNVLQYCSVLNGGAVRTVHFYY